jgi:pyruvate/2-oxoglutarate dehydrogenase complex dihydrolipoamide acyltransferase (E2) component
MRSTIKLPKLAETTDVMVLEQWLVAVGDKVEVDQAIASIATDKVTMDLPSPVAGTVVELHVEPDGEVRTGEPVCTIET